MLYFLSAIETEIVSSNGILLKLYFTYSLIFPSEVFVGKYVWKGQVTCVFLKCMWGEFIIVLYTLSGLQN